MSSMQSLDQPTPPAMMSPSTTVQTWGNTSASIVRTVQGIVRSFSSSFSRAGPADPRHVIRSGSSLSRTVTARVTQIPRRSPSARQALDGLRRISEATANLEQQALWRSVEKRFHQLASEDGTLEISDFAACIGQ